MSYLISHPGGNGSSGSPFELESTLPAEGTDCGGGSPIGTATAGWGRFRPPPLPAALPGSGDMVEAAVVVDVIELVLVRPILVAGGATTDPFDTVTLLDIDEGGRSVLNKMCNYKIMINVISLAKYYSQL